MALRVWLPLNGDLRNQGISNLNTIIMPTCATIDNSGKIGKCYTSDGTVAGVSTNFNFQASEFSIAAWVRINTRVNAWRCPIKLIHSTEKDYIGFCCEHNTQASYIGFHFYKTIDNTNTPIFDTYPITDMPIGEWVHLTVTYNGKTAIYYKNGIKINSSTIAAAKQNAIANIDRIIMLGSDGGRSGAAVKSSLNDVRIYDNCLSAAEVREISQGLVLHYKLDAATQSQTNLVPCGTTYTKTSPWTITTKNIDGYKWVTNSAFEATPSTTYTISVECDGTLSTGHGPGDLSIDQKPWSFWLYICNVDTTKSWQNGAYDSPINLNKNNYNYRKIGNAHVWTYTLSNTQKYISLRTNCYSDGTNNITINWWNMKIEKGSIYTPCGDENYIIQDSSGYNHNGTIIGDLMLISNSQRYSAATKWNCSDPTTNNNTGLCYIQTPLTLTTPLQMSITWWAKPESGYGGSTSHAAFCTSNNTSAPTDYNTTAFHHRDSGFDIYPSDGSGVKRLSFTYTKNEWHHYAVTYDGTTARAYQDGVLKTSIEIGANKTLASFSQLYIGFSKAGGAWRKTLGSYSDFRVYVTQLLDTDVKQLYNVGMKVDKGHNIHVYEFQEQNINLFSSIPWTAYYSTHSTTTNLFTNYNTKNEPQFVTNGTSAGSNFIEITPGIYEYDYTISVNAGNQFYIGFERYDADKTSRSNAACVYTYATKPSSDVVKQRYKGTVDLSTDGVNTIKYIALRILNGWSGTTSGVTGQATIHNLSLRLQSAATNPQLTKTGQLIGDEFKEYSNAKFYKDHIIEANHFIER